MAVISDGSYGVAAGLMYSFPVTCSGGQWKIVQGLKIDQFSRQKMDATAAELTDEKQAAWEFIHSA
jgi:malate dehydrogenase